MAITANLFVNQKGSTTSLKQPKQFGQYSRTQEGEFLINDDSRLNYYYLPDSDLDKYLDLSSGIKKFKDCSKQIEDRCSLRGLLKTIMINEQRKDIPTKADIITFRGVMRKLISAAFDTPEYNPVDLRIVSFDGQIFIKDVTKQETQDPIDLNCYTGYKFESLATLSQPLPLVSRTTLEKRPKKISSNGDEYIAVVKTGVGSSKLVLGAEIDCIFDFKEENKDNLRHYAELKCSTQIITAADAHRFERKLFKTWLQCFLVGIPRIIYGFRDENYTLKSVEEFSTEEVPILLKEHNPKMNTSCIDAIKWYGLLTEWLLKLIPRDSGDEIRPYRLVFENNHLRLTEIEKGETEFEDIVNGESVLTNEFKEWRRTLRSKSN
ncbi:decapping nuclease NDAI_0I03260 [Naumovozyma dairenensis CBS 421]|uniref:Decapping nuclease n=1 Tax=Naumovozyma dairenensis (strain ATCC 10597 / BCRC 20456 / CBS 421 / NBRC 0211 / NRRL Y-12639) TaxID=1071378 RepID=G0WGI3_NAUDC|nr:hypothetical protein NDAI_0I03260 [Naumovozyma dairenensis CBS 421]CCD26894.1 hypothetical protein NDAI_0I03260 [Naumovozyma dairenensis CBS 421]